MKLISRRHSKNRRFLEMILIFLVVSIILMKQGGVFSNLFTKNHIIEIKRPEFTTKPKIIDFKYPLEGDISTYTRQLKSGLKPDVDPINLYNYTFLLYNKTKCKTKKYSDKITLLILVKSAMKHRSNRGAIRKTWGQEKQIQNIELRIVFLIGISPDNDEDLQTAIETEHQKHGDMIQSEFIDSYYNNTVKTMQGFRWIVEKCSNIENILFTDDDMYISVKNVLNFITEFMDNVDTKYLYAGCVFHNNPIRNKLSKWYISLEDYPYSTYPPFVNAGAFILSHETLFELFYGSMYTKHIRFDDVFLGLVAHKVNINLTHNDHFLNWKLGYGFTRYKPVIACHGFGDPNALIKVWNAQNG